MTIAQVRTLRLALGTALSLWVSQAVGWQVPFIAPVLTSVVLALPVPAPKLKAGIGLCLVLSLSTHLSLLLLPWLLGYPLVGLLLLGLALFWTFYFTASGGPQLLGTLATMGIALSTAVGSVNVDIALQLANALTLNAAIGIAFVWIAHALLPDSRAAEPLAALPKASRQEKPDPVAARWSALRSLVIVLPVALWFMLSSASASYVPVMIKVAAMGQQATNEDTRLAGRSLLWSTVIGGIGAIVGWQVLSIAPTLSVYVLFVALAGLVMGARIFKGPGLAPNAPTWSYGYLTMIVILAPAVTDSVTSSAAGAAFWSRLFMFVLATAYAYAAVYAVSAIRPGRARRAERLPN